MPPDPADAAHEAASRHELSSQLTVVCLQTQVLHRQVRRIEGIAECDRERLEVGLLAILASANAIGATLSHLPPSGGPGQAIRPP